MLRHLCLLDILNELNKGFPTSQCLGVTALDDVVCMKYDEETARFLVCSNHEFIHHKHFVFYARVFYHSALSLRKKVEK